jgi:hypothetical protein
MRNGRVTLQRVATFLIGAMRIPSGVPLRRHVLGEVQDTLLLKVAGGVPTFLSVQKKGDSANPSPPTVKAQRRAFCMGPAQLGGPIASVTRLVTITKKGSRTDSRTNMFLWIVNHNPRASPVSPNVERHRVPLTGTSVVSLTSSMTRSKMALFPHTGTRARDASVSPRTSYSSNRENRRRKQNSNGRFRMNSKRTATVRTS